MEMIHKVREKEAETGVCRSFCFSCGRNRPIERHANESQQGIKLCNTAHIINQLLLLRLPLPHPPPTPLSSHAPVIQSLTHLNGS